ncbi:MAG: hypothetical protein V1733_04310 [bacterium]
MKKILFPFIFLTVTSVYSQQTTFTSVFYDLLGSAQGYGVVQSADSNFFIAGEKDDQALFVKMDPYGINLWGKKYVFAGNSAFFCRIIPTHDSQFILIGSLDFGYSDGDLLCMKLTASGDTTWTKSIDFGHSEYATYIQETSDHGFILCGTVDIPGSYNSQMLVIKLDSAGSLEWATTLSGATYTAAHSVKEAPDHGFYVTGGMENSPGWETMAILVRLTSDGNITWAKRLSSNALYAQGFDVVVTGSGLLCLVEFTYGTLLIKTDYSGNIIWSKNYSVASGFTPFEHGQRAKLHPTSDAGFIFVTTGQFGSMLKVDSTGLIDWSYELFLESMDVIESLDHGFLIVGNGPILGVELYPTDHPQIGLIKTDSLGNTDDCVFPTWWVPDTMTTTFIPVSLTTGTGWKGAFCP